MEFSIIKNLLIETLRSHLISVDALFCLDFCFAFKVCYDALPIISNFCRIYSVNYLVDDCGSYYYIFISKSKLN